MINDKVQLKLNRRAYANTQGLIPAGICNS